MRDHLSFTFFFLNYLFGFFIAIFSYYKKSINQRLILPTQFLLKKSINLKNKK